MYTQYLLADEPPTPSHVEPTTPAHSSTHGQTRHLVSPQHSRSLLDHKASPAAPHEDAVLANTEQDHNTDTTHPASPSFATLCSCHSQCLSVETHFKGKSLEMKICIGQAVPGVVSSQSERHLPTVNEPGRSASLSSQTTMTTFAASAS